jgi:hypothetical protein
MVLPVSHRFQRSNSQPDTASLSYELYPKDVRIWSTAILLRPQGRRGKFLVSGVDEKMHFEEIAELQSKKLRLVLMRKSFSV